MRAPATRGARVDHGQSRKAPARRKPASSPIKASRGSGKRKSPLPRRVADPVAETRQSSLNSLNAQPASPRKHRAAPAKRSAAPKRSARTQPVRRQPTARSRSVGPTGGGTVRAVAVGAGGAAVGAVRVATEVARPAARPVLRVITGGIDKLPTSANVQPYARGRIMIMIAAILGAGLIYINVGKLQAGDGYSKYSARSQVLQRENTALRAKVAFLSSPERIQKFAQEFGMVPPVPEQFKYLHTKRGDALKAMKNYTAPAAVGASPTAAGSTAATGAVDTVSSTQASTTPATNQSPVTTEQTTAPAGQ
jgi:hypothetical protein